MTSDRHSRCVRREDGGKEGYSCRARSTGSALCFDAIGWLGRFDRLATRLSEECRPRNQLSFADVKVALKLFA